MKLVSKISPRDRRAGFELDNFRRVAVMESNTHFEVDTEGGIYSARERQGMFPLLTKPYIRPSILNLDHEPLTMLAQAQTHDEETRGLALDGFSTLRC